MQDNKFKPYPKGSEPEEGKKGHHPPPPHHDLPPHILKEFFEMKEKIGRLEGKVEILTMMLSKRK